MSVIGLTGFSLIDLSKLFDICKEKVEFIRNTSCICNYGFVNFKKFKEFSFFLFFENL